MQRRVNVDAPADGLMDDESAGRSVRTGELDCDVIGRIVGSSVGISTAMARSARNNE